METIGAIAVVLLVLACPLGMLAIGGVAWVVARSSGEKKDFSMNCMQHGEGSARSGDEALRDQVTRLQAEVESYRATVDPDAPIPGNSTGANRPGRRPGLSKPPDHVCQ